MRLGTYFLIATLFAIFAAGCTISTPEPTPTEGQAPTTAPTIAATTSAATSPTTIARPLPTAPPSIGPADAALLPVVESQPRQLTSSPGDELDPAWDPRGGTIAYMTTKPGAVDRPYDIGAIDPDGTGKRVLATGPNLDIGIAGELSWVGETGLLMTNERISFHAYMTFDTAKAPFDRRSPDGDDDAFVSSLAIPGGMGGDGLSFPETARPSCG